MTLKAIATPSRRHPTHTRQESLKHTTNTAWQEASEEHPDFFKTIADKTISDLKQWYPPLVPSAHPELRNALISFFPLLKPVFDGIDQLWDLGKKFMDKLKQTAKI